jgi:hypothetical protein
MKKEKEEMNPSTQVAALWQRIKKTGHGLVLISVLTLLVLIAGGVGFLLPATRQMQEGQTAATNGNVHIGGSRHALSSQVGDQMAATNGTIHINS